MYVRLPIIFGLSEENMHLFIMVIRLKKHKATIISKLLPSYTCFLENYREKHGEKRRIKVILARISQMKKGSS